MRKPSNRVEILFATILLVAPAAGQNKATETVNPVATAQGLSSEDLSQRTIERRAVEGAIWGMPLVNTDAMRQAYFRDVGAKYNDVCFFSKAADWRFQVTTPNASTNYVYFNFNLKDGPVVTAAGQNQVVA